MGLFLHLGNLRISAVPPNWRRVECVWYACVCACVYMYGVHIWHECMCTCVLACVCAHVVCLYGVYIWCACIVCMCVYMCGVLVCVYMHVCIMCVEHVLCACVCAPVGTCVVCV